MIDNNFFFEKAKHWNRKDTVQLARSFQGINPEFTITEELVELVVLKGSTTGKYFLDGFLERAPKMQLDLKKLV